MAFATRILSLGMAAVLLAACASPPADPEAVKPPAPKWSAAAEDEVAAALDRKFEDVARGYVKLKKDGVLMFCKRERVLGSSIPTLQCITEAQLRTQVENMDEYRARMRNTGKCPRGPQGCSGQ